LGDLFQDLKKNLKIFRFFRFFFKIHDESGENAMKRATYFFLAAMIISAAVTFICTNAKATNCPCWWAEWTPPANPEDPQSQGTCRYFFCLPIPEEQLNATDHDYQFYFYNPELELYQYVWLEPQIPSPCGEGCVQYWGQFMVHYDPREILEWKVLNDENEVIDEDPHMQNCNFQ
jgi:hypothetical protein